MLQPKSSLAFLSNLHIWHVVLECHNVKKWNQVNDDMRTIGQVTWTHLNTWKYLPETLDRSDKKSWQEWYFLHSIHVKEAYPNIFSFEIADFSIYMFFSCSLIQLDDSNNWTYACTLANTVILCQNDIAHKHLIQW